MAQNDIEFALSHSIPAEVSIGDSTASPNFSDKLMNSAPLAALQNKPYFEEIGELVKGRFDYPRNINTRCDKSSNECRTATMYHQYGKGADWWGTPSFSFANLLGVLGGTKMMDIGPANQMVDFINDYFSKKNSKGKRKRFPALFTIYFSALDHAAHGEGMGSYVDFFKNTTDPEILKTISALKKEGEFDNKIFIILSDHGMTAMPDSSQMVLEERDEDGNLIKSWQGDASCKLKLDGFGNRKVQFPELANNNLHIWELANLFKQFPYASIELKVLAPEQISKILDSASNDPKIANIAVGLNGPMAHIYIRGENWESDPDQKLLGIVLDRLNKVLKDGSNATGSFAEKVKEFFPNISSSIDIILVRKTLSGEYGVLNSITAGTNGDKIINTIPLDTYFTDKTEYINAINRINDMKYKDRSGDVILIMKDRMSDYVGNRFTTGVACKSWHGGLNASDSYVPFILAYPGGNKYEIDDIIKEDTLCKEDYSNCMGNWKVKDIIIEIIKNQY